MNNFLFNKFNLKLSEDGHVRDCRKFVELFTSLYIARNSFHINMICLHFY